MADAPRPGPLPAEDAAMVHATGIVAHGRAALFLGPSGSGKSALALECLARGARLVGDDRVRIQRRGVRLIALPPPRLSGLIEARGVGLLHAPVAAPAPIAVAVKLDRHEAERLPPRRTLTLMGVDLPLFHNPATPAFPAAILLYLSGGRFA
jgi:HPr kinase/phosphorylase